MGVLPIYIQYSYRIDVIADNVLHDLSGNGIYMGYSSKNGSGIIRDNKILKSNSTSLQMSSKDTYHIYGNMIDGGNGHGMHLESSKSITARSNTIQNKNDTGMYIESSTGNATSQWKVVSNVIKDNGSYGVRINYASVNVDSNTISGHSNYGVYIQTNFESPAADTLRYNTIINNKNYGIKPCRY